MTENILAFPNSEGEIKKVVMGTVIKLITAPNTGPTEKPINFFKKYFIIFSCHLILKSSITLSHFFPIISMEKSFDLANDNS